MTKSLQEYAKEWQSNAEADALWVILTDSRYYGRKWNEEEFFSTGEEEMRRIFNFMEHASIKVRHTSFLDFGCGVGRISRVLRKKFERGFGVDISPKMIELARCHVPDVEFLVNQNDSLERLEDNSIDFIYSHITLQHIPNEYQRRYLEEFLRILRPGGLAAFQIPIDVINPQEVRPQLAYRVKEEIKRRVPFLIAMKRRFFLSKQFHYEFRYEMHTLEDNEIRTICEKRGCTIEAAPATNSCDPDHNGRVEFYDLAAYRKRLKQSGIANRFLSCMYFVRKPLTC
jgi:ubiquinone/menaquinone biosynthesis C-methylase UbiE